MVLGRACCAELMRAHQHRQALEREVVDLLLGRLLAAELRLAQDVSHLTREGVTVRGQRCNAVPTAV